ncbi:hypothetical protein DACRYDRAFT_20529 [Dacryopinax primogenitus]|uniref:Uncharacterized protein n=1 Tax=Dacryopinax primogenitus (strain DJM 731) TaxID=1858805 RepID=M5G9K8_DACPD|nr:uncharacterized protein DACRYDRAFT_20529 [Dacryopinax primogenitus]EJU04955.1 hypothetical protein DACRYDRAFT_20529 [Dacryopinax primogenitus]
MGRDGDENLEDYWESDGDELGKGRDEELAVNMLLQKYWSQNPRHKTGHGAHAQWLATQHARWTSEMLALVEAYLRWQHEPLSASDHGNTSLHKMSTVTFRVVGWHGIETKTFLATLNNENMLGHIVSPAPLQGVSIHLS